MRIKAIIAAVCVALWSCLGLAQPAVTAIDFSSLITGLDGKPTLESDANGKMTDKPITLGTVVAQAAMAALPEDKDAKPMDLFRLRQMGARLYEAKAVVLTTASECKKPSDSPSGASMTCLTVADRDKLKDRIAKVWGGVVQYRAWLMLDPSLAE